MNEELQSTNDELQVINAELRGRTEELNRTNGFLGAVLRSLGSAVIVLTEDLRVRVWSPGAEDLWGLRPEEAESPGRACPWTSSCRRPRSRPGCEECWPGRGSGTSVIDLSALNRRGKTVKLRVAASPMRSEKGTISGLILVIDQAAE